jgi:hypothetical protein
MKVNLNLFEDWRSESFFLTGRIFEFQIPKFFLNFFAAGNCADWMQIFWQISMDVVLSESEIQ